jgi:DNA-binding MarR family transcriptional regulator
LSNTKREETIQAINEKFREMSTETIMFHQAVADSLGLHITDHKCLDLNHHFGAMPTGRLDELTGLTTGAVTGMIDRLEEAGYVRKTNDPKDRRQTIVEPTRNRKLEREIEVIFMPLIKECISFSVVTPLLNPVYLIYHQMLPVEDKQFLESCLLQ